MNLWCETCAMLVTLLWAVLEKHDQWIKDRVIEMHLEQCPVFFALPPHSE